MKIFRSSTTMFFANAELYGDALKQRCGVDVDRLISQKKKLLRRQELKLKRLQKGNKLVKKDTSISINVNTGITNIESNDVEGSNVKVSAENELEDIAAEIKKMPRPQPCPH